MKKNILNISFWVSPFSTAIIILQINAKFLLNDLPDIIDTDSEAVAYLLTVLMIISIVAVLSYAVIGGLIIVLDKYFFKTDLWNSVKE